MPSYEFKVIPAPRRAEKSREAKTTEDRFALGLTTALNRMAADGWDYVGSETLPCDERTGLRGIKTTTQVVMIFRRELAAGAQPQPTDAAAMPRLGPAAQPVVGAAPALGPAPVVAPGGVA